MFNFPTPSSLLGCRFFFVLPFCFSFLFILFWCSKAEVDKNLRQLLILLFDDYIEIIVPIFSETGLFRDKNEFFRKKNGD
jgi:hypothetical protein